MRIGLCLRFFVKGRMLGIAAGIGYSWVLRQVLGIVGCYGRYWVWLGVAAGIGYSWMLRQVLGVLEYYGRYWVFLGVTAGIGYSWVLR